MIRLTIKRQVGRRVTGGLLQSAIQPSVLFRPLSTCPVTGSITKAPSTSTSTSTVGHHPELKSVPSLPFVGSTIPWHSGIPIEFGVGRDFEFWPAMRDKFGDVYSVGIPGFGVGSHGECVVLSCPHEMTKVVRSEGKYPSGATQFQWGLKKVLKEKGAPIVSGEDDGFFGRDAEWKRMRTFIQTDLLNPAAAKGYLPGVIQAAELASKGAPAMSHDVNNYLNHCAFDMFSSVMFGDFVESADPNTEIHEEDNTFVHAAKTLLATNNILQNTPYEIIMGKLGIKTQNFSTLAKNEQIQFKIGADKIRRFLEKKERGELNEYEKNSWLSHAIDRQAAEGSEISFDEMVYLSSSILGAAVDTTMSIMSWNILHLGAKQNQKYQDRIYEEIKNAVASNGGRLTPDIFNKKKTPFLHAFVRETHRLTPANVLAVFKKTAKEVEIHGQIFPEGTFFVLEAVSTGQRVFEDAQTFRPERFLPEAIEARKGTPAEVVDHLFFQEPFSQGARKCPGARIAANENLVMLAQLILDWKISIPGVETSGDVPYKLVTAITPMLPKMNFEPRH